MSHARIFHIKYLLVYFVFFNLFFFQAVSAQDNQLPEGLRQHNLLVFNSSLLNPTASFDWNDPSSLTVWSRWQWQSIDDNPTTFSFNYSQALGLNSSIGVGYLLNNSGPFLRKGAVVNYSHKFRFSNLMSIVFGVNGSGHLEEISDLTATSQTTTVSIQNGDDPELYLRFTPGIRFDIGNFKLAIAGENLIDYNTDRRMNRTTNVYFSSTASYDIEWGDSNLIRPVIFIRTDPLNDTQFTSGLLYRNRRIWLNGSYNSFYGGALGGGVTFFDRLSLGSTLEFGLSNTVKEEKPTFELLLNYKIGERKSDAKMKEPISKKDGEISALLHQEELKRREEERKRLLRKQDSIINSRVKEQLRLDSIARLNQIAVYRPDEKHEEVVSMEGLQPGFYLITNVFGTQRYYEKFMNSLENRGLNPKSFKRGLNGYNYVYLKRFDTLEEIREARDSKFYGKYNGPTWIFRVKEE